MNKLTLLIGLIVILLISSNSVLSLGIMPASQEMLINELEPFELIIVNNENHNSHVTLDVQGDLKKYISLSKTKIKLTPGIKHERVTVDINIPKGTKIKEGEHLNYIIISQQNSVSNDISANINLAFKLNVVSPYTSETLDLKLYVTNFEQDVESNFALEVKNIGTKKVPKGIPVIDIYSPTGDKIDTITGERISLKKGESKILDMKWTPSLPKGKYSARAFIIYGEKTVSADKVFSIGTPEIIIDEMSTYSFKLGSVASIDLIISSNWVEPIENVYANIELKKDETVESVAKTASKTISSLGKTNLPVFINTQGLEPGKYNLSVELNYLGKTTPYTFDMILTTDDMTITGATGHVINKTNTDLLSSIWFLTVIILIFLGVNTFIIYKFVIKRNK